MTTRRARRPYRWLRRGLLLLLIVVVAGLGGLLWFGRQDRQPVRRGAPLGSEAAEGASLGDVATVGQGFEYTHYDAGRKRFTLRALRTVQDREETVFLEGVDMLVYEEAGPGYELSADKARYNREKQEALLEGRVKLTSGAGMTLTTEGLDLSQRGRVLTSTAPAEIVYGDAYKATGDRFRVHVPEDLFQLIGNARIDNLPGKGEPFSLRCKRLQLERQRQLLRADGGVEVTRPDGRVTAQSVNVFLTEDLAAVRFLRARWDVEGYSLLPPQAADAEEPLDERLRVDFSGRSFSTLLGTEGEEPQSAELEGSPTEPATLTTREGDLVRTITAGFLTTEAQPDGSQVVEAFGDPEIVEQGGDTPRRVQGGRGWARILPDGSLGQARMSEGVTYRAGETEIRGERGRFDLAAGEGSFVGTESAEAMEGEEGEEDESGRSVPEGLPTRKPLPRVTVKSARADLDAPAVTFAEKDGVVHARGGVSTVLHEGLAMPGREPGERASGEEVPPVRVQSREAFFRDQPRGALFRGEVRAWQDENLILAEWLRADEPADGPAKVTAGGGVRTVARPAPTATRPQPEPLTVTAEEMSYLDTTSGELIYEKGVKALDQGREIVCERLAVSLDANGGAERLEAQERVRLDDPAAGKKAQAERAVWVPEGQPGGGRVALFGDPAVVTDARGGEIKAPELTYELGTGRVQAGVSLPAVAMRGES